MGRRFDSVHDVDNIMLRFISARQSQSRVLLGQNIFLLPASSSAPEWHVHGGKVTYFR